MTRKMKDSGIEWIGEIPEDWEIIKLKHRYEFTTGFTPTSKNEYYYDNKKGYPWATIRDLSKSETLLDTDNKISQLYIEKHNPSLVPKGSLLYSFKLSIGVKNITSIDLYTNEAIAGFIKNDKIYSTDFLYYSSFLIEFNCQYNIYGAKLLNQDLIKNAKMVFPPVEKQEKIAEKLNKITRKVNDILKQTQQSIEELKKYKQSLITEAVTKGLDPNAEMKDSGIEWIGEIPKHWEERRIKYIFNLIDERNSNEDAELLSLYTSIGVKPRSELEERGNKAQTVINYKLVKKDDLIINKLLAWMGAIAFSDYEGVTSPDYDVYRIKNINVADKRYYNYYFRYTNFKEDCYKVGRGIMLMRWRTYPEQLLKIAVTLPPIKEQRQIVSYLDEQMARIDQLIEDKTKVIEELEDYKKSLIYEYVTGKKEV